MACFKVLSEQYNMGNEENHKKPLKSSKYKAGVLTTQPCQSTVMKAVTLTVTVLIQQKHILNKPDEFLRLVRFRLRIGRNEFITSLVRAS
jgi:hypothetical protein